jgi:hypothetical protein
MAQIVKNSFTPNAAAKHECLFNKPISQADLFTIYVRL